MTNEVVWIIAIICTVFLLIILTLFAWVAEQEKKHKDGEHHCNRCECSFVYGRKDLSRTYCPYCGHKLTKHKEHPDFIAAVSREEKTYSNAPFTMYVYDISAREHRQIMKALSHYGADKELCEKVGQAYFKREVKNDDERNEENPFPDCSN